MKLRDAEILHSQGKKQAEICMQIQVSQQTYVRWRKEYGGVRLGQAKRLKELENSQLKKVIADLSIDNWKLPRESFKSGEAEKSRSRSY